jgi:hypothetical protein
VFGGSDSHNRLSVCQLTCSHTLPGWHTCRRAVVRVASVSCTTQLVTNHHGFDRAIVPAVFASAAQHCSSAAHH